MNYPGRFFPVDRGMGDLPDTALVERGEYGVSPPMGLPPMGGDFIPGPAGSPQGIAQSIISDKQSNWQSIPFTVGTSVIKLQDFLARKFFLLQNLSGAGTLFFGFGWTPTTFNSLTLPPGTGYEPFSYPTNEIYVVANAPNTVGLLIYGS